MNPTVSVIVPCYNQAPYLSEALQSVFEQTYRDWECIIVDDGSSDDSGKIALQWAKKDERFKYYHKENSGVCDTRNFAIVKATGTYILPLDADDKMSSAYLKDAIDIFTKQPDTKVVFCNSILFGKNNRKIIAPEFQFETLLYENHLPCSSFFKREDFFQTIGYNPNMRKGLEDWDFWISFINPEDKVVRIDKFHLYYRIKDVSRSTEIDKAVNEELLLQLFKNHADRYLQYSNPIRDRIEAKYYKKEYQLTSDSIEYRIGHCILSPIHIVRKVFHRIFGSK